MAPFKSPVTSLIPTPGPPGTDIFPSFTMIGESNQHPLLIEGTLYDADPQVRAINQNFCAQFDALLSQGVFFDGQQFPGIKQVVQLATVAPNDPSLLPGFPQGFTNHQAFVAILSTPQVTPTSPRPDYFLAAGDAQQDRFFS